MTDRNGVQGQFVLSSCFAVSSIEPPILDLPTFLKPDQREPVEVRVNPESIEIVSYPGPDPSIRSTDLKSKKIVARRYRNRRIGEFFKELEMTEGRCTGIPKIHDAMKRNGSPKSKFTTDGLRLWFLVELPIHPAFIGSPLVDSTPQVTPQVRALLKTAMTPCSREQLQAASGIRDREHFRKQYLSPLLEAKLLEMTIPDKPRSSLQQYRTTPAGRAALVSRKTKS